MRKKGEPKAIRCGWCGTFSDSTKRVVKEDENGKIRQRYCNLTKRMVEGTDGACPSFKMKDTFWCIKINISQSVAACLHRQKIKLPRLCGKCPQGKNIAWMTVASGAIKPSPVRLRQREG